MIPTSTLNISLRLVLLCVACGICSPVGARPSQRTAVVPDVRFVASRAARGIPFELHNNHIYLRVNVNDSEPLSFILDTGASPVISQQRARALGLRSRGSERGFGVGETSVEAAIVEGVSLRLPGVALDRQTLAAIPLENLQTTLGRPVDGILGYSFFRRLVVEIDYAARIINLYSPGSYSYRGRGERIPLIIDRDSELIFARARIKPLNRRAVSCLCEIDTGGGHALMLNRPFVEIRHLLTPAQRNNSVLAGGIGGASRVVSGTVESVQLGRAHVENVVTLFSLAADGMSASEEFDGNIGNDVLRRFKVFFDYSRRLMILESRAKFN